MFLTTFVRQPDVADLHKVVGQFEQMHQSQCFIQTGGALGCASCHDPHAKPAEADKDRHYADRCLNCHTRTARDCSETAAKRRAKSDSCIECHMPRPASSNIAHTSITDHQIPRTPNASSRPRGPSPGATPIFPFPIGPHVPSALEQERDLGIAMARVISHIPAGETEVRRLIASMAASRLTQSVSAWPNDVPAWIALCRAHETRNDNRGLLEAATTAAGLAPDSEEAQGKLAWAAASAGELDTALAAADATVRMNPTAAEPYLLRAWVYLFRKDWPRAEADCRAALRIHPLHPRAHLLLGVCRHRRGDPAGGRKEADLAAALATKPEQRTALLDLYSAQTK
jgi:hypothetical protein